MRAVNLLPQQERRGGMPTLLTKTSVLAGGATVLTAVLLSGGTLFVQSHGQASDRRDTLASIEQELTKVQAAQARIAAQQAETPVQQGTDQAHVAAFTTAAGARMKWDDLFDDISRVLPDGTWLSSLNAQGGATAPAATDSTTPTATVPASFTVSGAAFSQDLVARVMERLELVPALTDVTLQSSSRTTVGTTKAYQFSMSANVLPEVPQP